MSRTWLVCLFILGCGGGEECRTVPCDASSYQICAASGGTSVRYVVAGQSCRCASAGCSECAALVTRACAGLPPLGDLGAPPVAPVDLSSVTPSNGAYDLATPPAPTNQPVGAVCGSNADCASHYCVNNACTCNKLDNGYACQSNNDCCNNGYCVQGQCVSHAPGCIANGASCAGGATCCVGVCDSTGTSTCVCTKGGDLCEEDQQCCGGSCGAPNPSGYRTCDLIRDGYACVNNADCSSGNCASGKCACAAKGALCHGPNDCCSLSCPFPNGTMPGPGAIGTCG